MTADSTATWTIIDKYRSHCVAQDFYIETVDERHKPEEFLRMELQPQVGSGWLEMRQIREGLNIGTCDYSLHRQIEQQYCEVADTLAFNLLLSGEIEFCVNGEAAQRSVRSNELWFWKSYSNCIRSSQPAGRMIRGVSIELPVATVGAWLDEAPDELARTLEMLLSLPDSLCCRPCCGGANPLVHVLSEHSPIIQTATRLLAAPKDTFFGQLQFESLAIDLLMQLLSGRYSTRDITINYRARQRAKVDAAVDILREEWTTPPTITALARRVGLNECYLKAWFRKQTGMSVGEYVRKLRMENALELIESGRCTVLEAAFTVGYSNPSHFSSAFKRFHGRLPSCFLVTT